MQTHNAPPVRHSDPAFWLNQIFAAKSAEGGVVRRAIAWVDREIGRDRFCDEVRRRGFHLVMTENQFIVVCNRGSVRLLF